MAFAREDREVVATRQGQDPLDGLDWRPPQGQVVAHAAHVAANTAEIRLHINHDQGRIGRAQIAIIRPGVRIRFDICCGTDRTAKAISVVATAPAS
jgi:hypothetical protein